MAEGMPALGGMPRVDLPGSGTTSWPARRCPADVARRPSRVTRELVEDRDGRCCVVSGRGGIVHLHHRRPVRSGGNRDPQTHSPANLVCACAGCHRRIHGRPEWAREAGLLLRSGADPAAAPVRVHGLGLVCLHPVGGLMQATAPGGEQR